MPTSPCSSGTMTGRARSATDVRRWMPAASLSPAPNPSRTGESWLPLVITTGMRARANVSSAASSTFTASVDGTARSYTSPATTTASAWWLTA